MFWLRLSQHSAHMLNMSFSSFPHNLIILNPSTTNFPSSVDLIVKWLHKLGSLIAFQRLSNTGYIIANQRPSYVGMLLDTSYTFVDVVSHIDEPRFTFLPTTASNSRFMYHPIRSDDYSQREITVKSKTAGTIIQIPNAPQRYQRNQIGQTVH